MRPRRGIVAFGTLALVAGLTTPAAAYPRPGATERVSVASDGTEQSLPPPGSPVVITRTAPAISADGRYVAFQSSAPDLVPGDTNLTGDIFVRDRQTGATERVSVASDGTQQNASSPSSPAISADGRYVAFSSTATNLVPDDTNGAVDIFVHDRATGTTERVSVASDGTHGNGASTWAALSADGRHVAFESFASNLVPGDTNSTTDIFVHDRQTRTTERVSVASDGSETSALDGGSRFPAISADGRHVAFMSFASTLVADDTNTQADMFVHDRETGTTELVSVASDGTQQNVSSSAAPAISGDGRYVAFHSTASNLVPGYTNRCGGWSCFDVYVHDRETRTTERVSVASDGMESDGMSLLGPDALSADGRYVVFESIASNLVAEDTNGAADIFVRDREVGTTERVSVGSDGTQGNGLSGTGAVTPDGRHVAFSSAASNLVPEDTNGRQDIFVRDRGVAVGVGTLTLEAGKPSEELAVSAWARFAGVMLTSAQDPADDGVDQLGAEITGASVIYQPEEEALLMRLDLASLPSVSQGCVIVQVQGCSRVATGAGIPRVLYRFDFEVEGARYEVRALRDAGADAPGVGSQFSLHECSQECTETAGLSGGIGTTGVDVRISVPLEGLGVEPGSALTNISASVSAPLEELVPLSELDEVELPDASIPATRVEIGIAPPSAAEGEVVFSTEGELVEGRFSGTVDVSSLPEGPYRVWARACLGETTCGPAAFSEVTL